MNTTFENNWWIWRRLNMNRSKEACHCRNITYGMIEDAIKNGAETFQEVQDATGAAKGCGQCKEFLICLIRDIKEEMSGN